MTVERGLLDLALSTRRGATEKQLFHTGSGLREKQFSVFEDEAIVVEATPNERLDALAIRHFPEAPHVLIRSDGLSRRISAAGSGIHYTFEPITLPAGKHELVFEATLRKDLTMRHRVRLRVDPVPKVRIEWVEPPRQVYWQHERAFVEVDASFPVGDEADLGVWLDDVVFEADLRKLNDPEAAMTWQGGRVPGEELRVRFSLPTTIVGEHRIELRGRHADGESSNTLSQILEVRPLFVFEARQGSRLLVSSLGGQRLPANPEAPFTLHAKRGDSGSLHVDVLHVLATDVKGVAVFPRATLGLDEVREEALPSEESSVVFTVEAEARAEGRDQPLSFRWRSEAVETYRPPWIQSPSGRLAIGLGASLAALLLFLAVWLKRDAALPRMRGKITWVSPTFRAESFELESTPWGRFIARGQRRRRLRIGAGGDASFGVDPEEFGLGPKARVDIEIVAGETLGREEDAFLVVRGSNGGGPTPILVEGHLQAIFPGQGRAELCLDEVTAPIVLSINAGNVSLHVEVDCVETT